MAVNDYRNQVTTELFEIKEGPDPSSATYIFGNEDHTLGNALRHVSVKHNRTVFKFSSTASWRLRCAHGAVGGS